MWRGGAVVLGVGGLALMSAAAVWAPMQPELIPSGGACQVAPCGTLEDPVRWRQAWWLWSLGALLATVAAPAVLPPCRPTVGEALLLLGSLIAAALALTGVAFVVSLLTSVQGAATTVALVPLAGLAVLSSWLRGARSERRP